MSDVEHIALGGAEGASWTLLGAGDFALARGDATVDAQVQEWIKGADVAMVNFEGALADGQKPIEKIGPHVEMDARAPRVLREMGFTVAGLANNHAMDFGAHALARTMAACGECGLNTCGAGTGLEAALRPAQVKVGARAVSVFSFCEREFGVATQESAGTAPISHARALAVVAEARKREEVVIVAAHGGVEHAAFSPVQRRDQLRQFVDAGASVVVGHHPHVMQGWEQYGEGLIFHSLGNFFFVPGFATSHKTSWSCAVRVHMRGARATGFDLLPTTVDSQGKLRAGAEAYEQRVARLKRLSALLAQRETGEIYWRAQALQLWESRYERLLLEACGGAKLRTMLRPWVQRARALRHGTPLPARMAGGLWRELLLLNLVRTESHRWTVETALAELSAGRGADARAAAELRELLA